MDEQSIKKHSIYQYADEVKKICEDLFSHTPVNYFCLGRVYPNGDYGGLLSSEKWAQTYLENDYQDLGIEHYIVSQIKGDFFWNLTTFDLVNKKGRCLYDSLAEHGQASGVFLIEEGVDYKEVAMITSPHHKDSNDPFLINNLLLLKNFVLYFKDQLHGSKELQRAFLKRYPRRLPQQNPIKAPEPTNLKFSIKNYYLDHRCFKVSLTKREAECLKYRLAGKTAKEIAQVLQVSPRTVETYFERIKKKTHSDNLTEVCKKLESSFLVEGV